VAAGEEQAQPVVAHRTHLLGLGARVQQQGLRVPVGARGLPPQPVDRLAAGGRDEPALGAGRRPVGRPAPDRLGERVLDRLLGGVDVAGDADQDGHRAAVLPPEDGRQRGVVDEGPHGGPLLVSRGRRPPSAGPRSAAW
jgi:hypothetical protein